MLSTGVTLAALSGLCNGLFTAPMKLIPRWKWENIWFVFILVSCLLMPLAVVGSSVRDWTEILAVAPAQAKAAALGFGFLWVLGPSASD
jgi:L-rhamnose-H+ transport protein